MDVMNNDTRVLSSLAYIFRIKQGSLKGESEGISKTVKKGCFERLREEEIYGVSRNNYCQWKLY